MAEDDAAKVLSLLQEKFTTLNVSVSTVKRARMDGEEDKVRRTDIWIKEKWGEWCKERLETGDMDFDDVIFTDECTVQLESHRRIKKGQPIKYKTSSKGQHMG